jgi:hypothetical protein
VHFRFRGVWSPAQAWDARLPHGRTQHFMLIGLLILDGLQTPDDPKNAQNKTPVATFQTARENEAVTDRAQVD